MVAISYSFGGEVKHKHASNRGFTGSRLKKLYPETKCMFFSLYRYLKTSYTRLILTKISKIVFRDIKTVKRVSSFKHVQKYVKC